jgi:hypothetical protein
VKSFERQNKGLKVSPKLPNLRKLEYSVNVNPLVENHEIRVRHRHIKTGLRRDLTDTQTGEITAAAVVHTIEEKDDAEFVKVFAAGISATYELTKTAQKTFQAVLDEYQRTPMSGGFADTLYLAWMDGGLSGRDVGISEKTFQRGLKELLSKGFLAPRSPSAFWVNPSLFFKGDRVLFLREYRRKVSSEDQRKRDELERRGQTRIVD